MGHAWHKSTNKRSDNVVEQIAPQSYSFSEIKVQSQITSLRGMLSVLSKMEIKYIGVNRVTSASELIGVEGSSLAISWSTVIDRYML